MATEDWIQESLARLEGLEEERNQHEAALETSSDVDALRMHTQAIERLDVKIRALYAELESAAEQGADNGEADVDEDGDGDDGDDGDESVSEGASTKLFRREDVVVQVAASATVALDSEPTPVPVPRPPVSGPMAPAANSELRPTNAQTVSGALSYPTEHRPVTSTAVLSAVSSRRKAQPGTAPRSLGWLHLTDLHQGMGGASWLWPNVKAQLFVDLGRLHDISGPWDLVFFTGDLTQRGSREEFDQLDRTLEQLWLRLEKLGSRPQLIAVPGNHDLTRPKDPFEPVVLALQQWHENRRLRDHVFGGADNAYRAALQAAFAAYSEWARRGRWTTTPRIEGALPGDVALSLALNGLDVGVIGLNSSFLQLTDGDYVEKLDVDPRQLHEVCSHDAPDWLQRHDFNFLLTHHPPEWLAPRARQEFHAEIDVAGRFAAHFYGHMHEGTAASMAVGGAAPRHTLQGASLFGLEEYQSREGRRMQRIHGYSAGRIELGASGPARVKIFPRRMLDNKLGRRIERDQDNFWLDERGSFGYEVPVGKTAR